MNKIPNRQAICEVLMKHAETDKDIVVLCSDSRGSASLTRLQMRIRSSLWRWVLRSRIWSAFLPVLQNAARKHLRHLRRASFLQEAMSRRKLTVHTPTPM